MGIGEIASPAVFLDRDGVINRNVPNPATGEYEAPRRAGDFTLLPDAIPALSRLQQAGFRLFLVSNQPDYAKGKASLEALNAVHQRLVSALEDAGITFSAFYYCYHHPEGVTAGYSGPCECRKPSPYFLLKAQNEFRLDLARSWMVGDRETDVACGIAAGVRTIRVKEDHPAARRAGDTAATFEANDLLQASAIILSGDGPEVRIE